MLIKVITTLICLSLSNLVYSLELKPNILKNLNWDQTILTKKDVSASLGQATFAEKNKEYFEIQGLRYPVSIEYKDNKVIRIFARYINQEIKVEHLRDEYKNFKREDNKEDKHYYLLISLDQKTKIKVRRSNDQLYSIEKFR